MQTLRFGSAVAATRYPLAISGGATWTRDGSGWSTTIPLPDIPNDHIVVPSFAELGTSRAEFTVTLDAHGSAWTLCPTAPIDCARASSDPRVTTHIDYFHCRSDLSGATVTVTVAGAAPPTQFLLTVGGRAFHRSPDAGIAITPRIVVNAMSQLTAPRALRHRICSPACIAMVLGHHGADVSLLAVTNACLHAPSKLYGVWPLAIRTAADAGCIGAVECFEALDLAAPILERGLPIIASIRFSAGGLPGAPLASTDGHLVVVTGLERDWVYVNDPAAPDASTVPRQYPREAFAAAWLSQRGAGYVLSPL